jgi:hypothetical protein
MKAFRTILTAAALLTGLGLSADTVQLTARPLAVSESWTESLANSASLTLTIHDSYRDQQKTVTTEVAVTRQVTILALAPNGEASDLAVTYVAATTNGTTLPVQGRTYHVSIQGNRVGSVTYAGGGAPPAEEEEFVRRENRSLDRVSAFQRIFDGIATDAWVDVPKPLAGRLMNVDDETVVDSMRVRFRGVTGTGDDAVAEFDASLSLVTPMKKGKNHKEEEAPFAGTLRREFPSGIIRVALQSCRPVDLDFHGTGTDTLSASRAAHGKAGKHDRMTVSGVGSSSLVMSWQR